MSRITIYVPCGKMIILVTIRDTPKDMKFKKNFRSRLIKQDYIYITPAFVRKGAGFIASVLRKGKIYILESATHPI